MKKNKLSIMLLVCLSSVACGALHAKQVPFIETPYLVQAPENISVLVDQVVQWVGLSQDYHITVPKKAWRYVNPWSQFIQGDIVNPESECIVITVNPEWFLSLPAEQQAYWIARSFDQVLIAQRMAKEKSPPTV